MVRLSDNPEAELVQFARTWFSHLARSNWDEALEMLDEPNCYGVVWTRQRILDLLEDTFGPETLFAREFGAPQFSLPGLATGRGFRSFGRYDDGSFWLDHDVPLNGSYSDLTAQFEFVPREEGFAAVLHDLHVM
jgi:hypothetical protein